MPEMLRSFNTLRARLTLWIAALLMASLALFGTFVYLSMAEGLKKSVDDSLQLSGAQTMAEMVDNGRISISDSLPLPSTITALHERGITIRIVRLDGKFVSSVGAFGEMPVVTGDIVAVRQRHSIFRTLIDPSSQEPVRFYTIPVLGENGPIAAIQVAQSLDVVNDTLEELLTVLLVSIPLLVVGAAGGGYLLATQALSPIDVIARTAARISAYDLHGRLNFPPTPDEVGRLACTFDSMLERLEDSFRRERQFVGDASHELRTPLTAMQTIISVMREHPREVEDYQRAFDDLADEATRLKNLTEGLLELARKDSQPAVTAMAVDLSTLLTDVTDVIMPLAEAKGLTVTRLVPEKLTVSGDGDDLIRLFMNLLDNATKYTDAGSIIVQASRLNECVCVTIADSGTGIDAAHLPLLFDRFYRVDLSRTKSGYGLGLSIAQQIAQAHGGTISVDSILGCGTTFTVQLPVCL